LNFNLNGCAPSRVKFYYLPWIFYGTLSPDENTTAG
jgi:hypothetical protein